MCATRDCRLGIFVIDVVVGVPTVYEIASVCVRISDVVTVGVDYRNAVIVNGIAACTAVYHCLATVVFDDIAAVFTVDCDLVSISKRRYEIHVIVDLNDDIVYEHVLARAQVDFHVGSKITNCVVIGT